MPLDYYPQKTVEQLEALLEGLQKRQTQGGVTEVSAAGVRTTRDFRTAGVSRTEVEIRRVLYSLFLRTKEDPNPENRYSDPYADMVRQTRARYTFS